MRPAEQVQRDRTGARRQLLSGHSADRRRRSRYPAAAVTHRTLLLVLMLALALAGCGGSDGSESESAATPTPKATATPDNKDTSKKPVVTVPDELPPDEIQTEDIVKGTGPKAKKGDTVTMQYVGVAWSTGVKFDSSWDRGQPFTFKLGEGKVIPGWDEGIPGMQKGGRRMLTIPAERPMAPRARRPTSGRTRP